jgi:hypothetical protein
VYAIHRNPFDLGLIGLAEFVPLPILALPAGQLADRLPRRLVVATALGLEMAVPALLSDRRSEPRPRGRSSLR